jgi:hypothetical protein
VKPTIRVKTFTHLFSGVGFYDLRIDFEIANTRQNNGSLCDRITGA